MTTDIKPIPEEFQTNGMRYTLQRRMNNVAIYNTFSGELHIGYEVHLIRKMKARVITIKGRTTEIPYREVLASNEDFGHYAWYYTLSDYASAEKQYLGHANWAQESRITP
jgi:hypothetical protein